MAEKKQPAEDIRIEDDAKLLADTLHDILRYSGDSADEAYITLKKNAENALLEVKARLGISDSYYAKAKQVANRADGYVHKKPWHGVGVGCIVRGSDWPAVGAPLTLFFNGYGDNVY